VGVTGSDNSEQPGARHGLAGIVDAYEFRLAWGLDAGWEETVVEADFKQRLFATNADTNGASVNDGAFEACAGREPAGLAPAEGTDNLRGEALADQGVTGERSEQACLIIPRARLREGQEEQQQEGGFGSGCESLKFPITHA
jgi:hypothetical protein